MITNTNLIAKQKRFTAFRFCDERKGGCGKKFNPTSKHQFLCEECRNNHKKKCLIERRTLCRKCRKPLNKELREQAYCEDCIKKLVIEKAIRENTSLDITKISLDEKQIEHYKEVIISNANSFNLKGRRYK
ncbi:MAG: hypothetical protein PHS54_04700 [Clostridia bacterium]|nr:hypothetical protein [Clostridia bacterium]